MKSVTWFNSGAARWAGVVVVALMGLTVCTELTRAENWPQWRGPKNNGISNEANAPTKWSKTENVAWRLPLPGPAGATPVVWGERIFLTSVEKSSGDLLLLCIGTDGKEKWRLVIGTGNRAANGHEGNSASNSPSTDGEHVWAMMTTGVLGCWTVEGKEVWKFNLQDRYGKFNIQFGMTSTPVLDGERLYVQLIHGDGNAKTREAVVVGLDKKTGQEIWKRDRPSDAIDENEHSYASPVIYDDGKTKFLLSHGADFIVAHDLQDGRELWRCGNLNVKTKYDRTLRFVASPVTGHGIIIVPTAKGAPVIALKPDGKGDITNDLALHRWRHAKTPDVPSPLIRDGLVYLGMADGQIHVLDEQTGELIYQNRGYNKPHRASPLFADGKVYLMARDGIISVIKAGREYEQLAQNDLGEDIAASPVFANGTLYLRGFENLWAIRSK